MEPDTQERFDTQETALEEISGGPSSAYREDDANKMSPSSTDHEAEPFGPAISTVDATHEDVQLQQETEHQSLDEDDGGVPRSLEQIHNFENDTSISAPAQANDQMSESEYSAASDYASALSHDEDEDDEEEGDTIIATTLDANPAEHIEESHDEDGTKDSPEFFDARSVVSGHLSPPLEPEHEPEQEPEHIERGTAKLNKPFQNLSAIAMPSALAAGAAAGGLYFAQKSRKEDDDESVEPSLQKAPGTMDVSQARGAGANEEEIHHSETPLTSQAASLPGSGNLVDEHEPLAHELEPETQEEKDVSAYSPVARDLPPSPVTRDLPLDMPQEHESASFEDKDLAKELPRSPVARDLPPSPVTRDLPSAMPQEHESPSLKDEDIEKELPHSPVARDDLGKEPSPPLVKRDLPFDMPQEHESPSLKDEDLEKELPHSPVARDNLGKEPSPSPVTRDLPFDMPQEHESPSLKDEDIKKELPHSPVARDESFPSLEDRDARSSEDDLGKELSPPPVTRDLPFAMPQEHDSKDEDLAKEFPHSPVARDEPLPSLEEHDALSSTKDDLEKESSPSPRARDMPFITSEERDSQFSQDNLDRELPHFSIARDMPFTAPEDRDSQFSPDYLDKEFLHSPMAPFTKSEDRDSQSSQDDSDEELSHSPVARDVPYSTPWATPGGRDSQLKDDDWNKELPPSPAARHSPSVTAAERDSQTQDDLDKELPPSPVARKVPFTIPGVTLEALDSLPKDSSKELPPSPVIRDLPSITIEQRDSQTQDDLGKELPPSPVTKDLPPVTTEEHDSQTNDGLGKESLPIAQDSFEFSSHWPFKHKEDIPEGPKQAAQVEGFPYNWPLQPREESRESPEKAPPVDIQGASWQQSPPLAKWEGKPSKYSPPPLDLAPLDSIMTPPKATTLAKQDPREPDIPSQDASTAIAPDRDEDDDSVYDEETTHAQAASPKPLAEVKDFSEQSSANPWRAPGEEIAISPMHSVHDKDEPPNWHEGSHLPEALTEGQASPVEPSDASRHHFSRSDSEPEDKTIIANKTPTHVGPLDAEKSDWSGSIAQPGFNEMAEDKSPKIESKISTPHGSTQRDRARAFTCYV
ncbi:hypothetical protein CDD82_3698 [Ophiocordyceps australis]|uniref:Uncharacterized protein n=1 Tax=Ophiocordyceps australis TaxID=1399860 RepID=A0A2C5ZBB8_9HYPO|nr:hypothetical protein CDD82_3698 [Ophiocordyceps australis]